MRDVVVSLRVRCVLCVHGAVRRRRTSPDARADLRPPPAGGGVGDELLRDAQHRGGCRHGVTLAHEQQHARIDDTVFARELPKLKQALARAATDIGVAGPVPSRGIAAHRDDIGERIERAFRHEVDRINETRRREQSALDTPESYRREAARCPDGMK